MAGGGAFDLERTRKAEGDAWDNPGRAPFICKPPSVGGHLEGVLRAWPSRPARGGCARLGTECALCSSSKKAAEEIKQRELKVSGADSTTGGKLV